MSADLHNAKYRGRSESWLKERAEQLYEEIDQNNEENRAMQSEINDIYEEIGRQTREI